MRNALRRGSAYAGAALFMALLILIWQWYATASPTFFLPTPLQIGDRLVREWLQGGSATSFTSSDALQAVWQTFSDATAGWLIGGVLGIVAGCVLGASRAVRDLANLPLLLVRSVPPVAVIPICIVLFGLGFEMKLAVVSFTCVWPTLLNTAAAVAAIEPVQLDVARLYGLNPVAKFFRVLVPASSPKIFAGLRISLALAIVISVGSELIAGSGGLGGRALIYQTTFDVPGLWATLAVLAVFGLVVNGVFLGIEKAALAWDRKRNRRDD